MAIEIKSTADISLQKLNVLLYGWPGAGKTRMIGSAAKKFKTIIASAEKGLLSLRSMVDDEGKPIKADFVDIEKFEDLEELTRFLMASNHGYECFGIDSGTEIQQVCMDYILKMEKRDKPQLQDWGTLNNKMVRMVRYFRDMPKMNMIMTALAEESKSEDMITMIKPLFQGQLQKSIAGYFDLVAYAMAQTKNAGTKDEITRHIVVCNSSEKLLTKDRSGVLPKIMPNDFTAIHNMIFNNQKGENKQ